LPSEGAYGRFAVVAQSSIAVKANGANSSFFINEEGKRVENLEKKGDYFTGLIEPVVVGIVTERIIDAIFDQQEKAPERTPGIIMGPYYDGIVNHSVRINIEDINYEQLGDYDLYVRNRGTGQIMDYGSPDLCIIDNKTGFAITIYSLGELPPMEEILILWGGEALASLYLTKNSI